MVKAKLKYAVALGAGLGLAVLSTPSMAKECSVTIGADMALTGSLGALGQQIANGARLAVSDVNSGGGVNGCKLKMVLADDQTSPTVGVDAAKKLVDINHVPAIIGALSSGVSMAMLTAVTAPGKVVLISPASTSPSFTKLAADGKTGGYWFRTAPSDALQGVAMGKVARDAKFNKVVVMYINNPYGEGLSGQFSSAFKALGGTITANVVYNPNQPSYRAEVTQALASKPDALFLVGYPGDGTTIAREWVSAGGPQKFLFPDGLQSQKFIDDVGAKYMKVVWGTAAGSVKTPSLSTFRTEYKKAHGNFPTQAYMTNAYDAVMVVALAMEHGNGATGTIVRDNIRKITGVSGTKVYAGSKGYARAVKLIKEGKRVRYVGTAGPLTFDKYGDIAGPMAIWTVKKGKVTNVRMMSVPAIRKIAAKIKG